MFRHSEISTEVGIAPFCFAQISSVASIFMCIFLLVKYSGNYLALFAAAMFLIVGIASSIVLFGMISDYAYIKDGILYMSYLLKRNSIKIEEIGKIELKDDIYHVYDRKNDEVGTINSQALGIDRIVMELDRNNVTFI